MMKSEILRSIYAALNRHDLDAAFDRMAEDVEWPDARDGGHVRGKIALRTYFNRHWAEISPFMEVLSVSEMSEGRLRAVVRQQVRDLAGELKYEQTAYHDFTFEGDIVRRMDATAIHAI